MHDGAVWKLDPTRDEWTDITPLHSDRSMSHGFGYGAIAVDPSCPTTLLATTFCRWRPGDEVFRSTDGGRTWQPILATARWDHGRAPWTRHFVPHWMSDVKLDPFDPAHAMLTTGYGISAVYLHGRVSGVLGIFRSDDGGSSFARLNDDAHQFGSVRQVTGDPRVPGRVYCATGGRGILRGDAVTPFHGSERRCSR
jgi:hypothetical protein